MDGSSGTRRLAIVTGASSGIGRSIALALAEDGWDVAFTYQGDGALADSTRLELAHEGSRAICALSDAGIKKDVDDFYGLVQEHYGRLPTLLVNNAGTQTWCSLLKLEESDWDQVIRTNLKGCFLNTQKFAQLLTAAQKQGAVVNIGSGSNKHPFPGLVDYTASKGGIEMLTRVAAIELGKYGITVNCVAPGAIEVERTVAESPDYAKAWSKVTPLGRIGFPQDVANAVLFLASSKGSFITGQTLWVDGGLFTMPNWAYPPDRS